MDINEYLKKNDMSAYDLALLCKVSIPLIYRLINGGYVSQKSAIKINRKIKAIDIETMIKK